jgi:serine phosphatase RsbU (regulator of sigma subunit)/putative methionine-R-sulfoxide reductase with GAF domain/anti-sigma regulatory factor (Ser/Thr protein kinase)
MVPMSAQVFPAQYDQLDRIRNFVGDYARSSGMVDRDVYAIQLAVDEACSNIIEHAYEGISDGRIEISCESQKSNLTILVSDWGKSFDPSQVNAPGLTDDLSERQIGGLGIFLMRKMMDKVKYYSAPGGGNRLELVKYRRGSKSRTIKRRRRAGWRELLNLAVQLFETSSLVVQRDMILEMATEVLDGEVSLWLDESHFRLPNSTTSLFPEEPASPTMRHALETGKRVVMNQKGPLIATPIKSQDLVIGVLQVWRRRGLPFKRSDMDALEALTSHIAVALLASHQLAVEQFRIGQLNLVRKVSSQITNFTDLNELCNQVTRLIQKTFNYYYVAIFTMEPGQSRLFFRSNAGLSTRRRGRKRQMFEVEIGQGVVGIAAESGNEILSNNVSLEPRFRHIAGLPETQSEVAIPIKMEDRVLGVLDIQSDKLNAIHPNDLLVLRALADSIAVAIEGTRLYSDLNRKVDQLSVISAVGQSTTSTIDLREMMTDVARLLHRRFGYPHVHLFTVHQNRRQVRYEAGSGTKSSALEGYVLDLDDPEGMIPWVARNGKIILSNDVSKDPRFRATPFPPANTRSELTVPLIFNKQVIGVLDIQSDRLDTFSDDDKVLFLGLADYLAAAIHNADQYRSEQWRRQVADSLREVAGLLSANASLEQVLEAILTELERNLPCDNVSIWLLDEEDIYCAAVHGATAAELETAKANSDAAAWLTRALLSRTPIIRKSKDPMGPAAISRGFESDHSSIAAPLRIGDQAVGVLTLSHHTPGRYGHEAQAIATTFASYAAVAIENARLFDASQEQAYASAALLQVAEAVVSLSDLDEIISSIVRILPILVGVERVAIYRWDDQSRLLQPLQEYELPEESNSALWKPMPADEFPLLKAVIERGVPVVSPETIRDPQDWVRIQPPEQELIPLIMQADDRLLMAFPLIIKDATLGILLAEEASGGRRFRSRRFDILAGVAQQAALAIQNDLFEQQMRTQERLETEVELARQIQKTFMPDSLPSHPAWELASSWRTARQVGGDFFDVFELPGNRLGVFIADVADKGMPAALYMVLIRTLMRAAVKEIVSPASALARVNELFFPDAQQGMFITAAYGVIDTSNGELTYANAGHNPPLWVHGDQIERLTRTGMALGVDRDFEISQQIVLLAPRDKILFYTDGVTEAFSEAGALFGEKRLHEAVITTDSSAAGLLDVINKSLDEFMGDCPPADDITMVSIKRLH